MGVVPPTVGESERGDVDFESDFEMEEGRCEREVLAMEGAGFVKRTYGVRSSCLEHSCAKLDQQLDGLRAVVPNSTRVSSWSLKFMIPAADCNPQHWLCCGLW